MQSLAITIGLDFWVGFLLSGLIISCAWFFFMAKAKLASKKATNLLQDVGQDSLMNPEIVNEVSQLRRFMHAHENATDEYRALLELKNVMAQVNSPPEEDLDHLENDLEYVSRYLKRLDQKIILEKAIVYDLEEKEHPRSVKKKNGGSRKKIKKAKKTRLKCVVNNSDITSR